MMQTLVARVQAWVAATRLEAEAKRHRAYDDDTASDTRIALESEAILYEQTCDKLARCLAQNPIPRQVRADVERVMVDLEKQGHRLKYMQGGHDQNIATQTQAFACSVLRSELAKFLVK